MSKQHGVPLFDDVELVGYEASPVWVRVNPFIVSGYRVSCSTMAKCFKSTVYLHNQTLNVWTHALGTFVVAGLLATELWALSSSSASLTWLDWLLVLLFCGSYGSQFLLSALYHAVMCHSAHVCFAFRQWDYIGVLAHIGGLEVVALLGLFVPPSWLGLPPRSEALVPLAALNDASNIVFVLAFGAVTTSVLLWTVYMLATQPERKYRLYLGMVTLTALSWALIWRLYAVDAPIAAHAAATMWDVQKWYAIGMLPFLYKIPERWIPNGTFDIWGASHQIWHICIILGTFNEIELLVMLFR